MESVIAALVLIQEAELAGVGAKLSVWKPTVHGSVSPDEVAGRLSLQDELGVESSEEVPILELDFHFESEGRGETAQSIAMRFTAWRRSWTDSVATPAGELFPEKTDGESRLAVTYLAIDCYSGHPLGRSGFGLEWSLGWKYFKAEYEFESAGGSLDDTESGGGLTLGLGAFLQPLSWFFAAGRASLAGLMDVPVMEAMGVIGVEFGTFRLEGGWRGFRADSLSPDDSLDLSIQGPFLGFEVRF